MASDKNEACDYAAAQAADRVDGQADQAPLYVCPGPYRCAVPTPGRCLCLTKAAARGPIREDENRTRIALES